MPETPPTAEGCAPAATSATGWQAEVQQTGHTIYRNSLLNVCTWRNPDSPPQRSIKSAKIGALALQKTRKGGGPPPQFYAGGNTSSASFPVWDRAVPDLDELKAAAKARGIAARAEAGLEPEPEPEPEAQVPEAQVPEAQVPEAQAVIRPRLATTKPGDSVLAAGHYWSGASPERAALARARRQQRTEAAAPAKAQRKLWSGFGGGSADEEDGRRAGVLSSSGICYSQWHMQQAPPRHPTVARLQCQQGGEMGCPECMGETTWSGDFWKKHFPAGEGEHPPTAPPGDFPTTRCGNLSGGVVLPVFYTCMH
jgi:hypothetical protein